MMTAQRLRLPALLAGLMLILGAPLAAQDQTSAQERGGVPQGEWRFWGADHSSTRYAPLEQINAENFEDLEVAWTWRGDNFGPEVDRILRSTPLYVDGILYTVAGSRRQVAAIDPSTGETLWTFREPETTRHQRSMRKNYGKGVAYTEVNGRGIILVVTPGFFMHALDAKTGRPVEGWGEGLPIPGFPDTGTVDLLAYMNEGDYSLESGYPNEHTVITSSSPPIVADGTIVVGNSHEQGYHEYHKENVPGDVLAFDAASGDFKWRFDVIPEKGQFGLDTWKSDAWKYTGNVSAWAPMSADPELGLVYVVTDGPTVDYYKGFAPGDNLFGTSIIALDLETGQRKWHYQVVHHDIWNYDNPTAPNLLDVTIDGEKVPILVQTTKQGWAYVLNRRTGEPIWPIPETEVEQGNVPGEWYSDTQPIPSKPAPYEMTGFPDSMIVDFTDQLHDDAVEALSEFDYGPVFNPPLHRSNERGLTGALHCPGANGGTNIPGGTVADPETGIIYVASTRSCTAPILVPGTEMAEDSEVRWTSGRQPFAVPYVDGIPPWKPPYSTITAIDMSTGEHLWQIPNGDTPERIANHPRLEGVDLPNTGQMAHATAVLTETLLMYGEGRGARPLFHAVDKQTGEEVGTVELPAPTNTAPMTFMHEGEQYIVAAVGGGQMPGSLVALKLP